MLKEIRLPIGQLFHAIEKYENHQFIEEKEFSTTTPLFTIDEFGNDVRIKSLIKKKAEARTLRFSNGSELTCADKHLLAYDKRSCIRADNLNIGDTIVLADDKVISLKEIKPRGKTSLFDFEIDSPTHLYQTPDGLIHHNTSLACYLAGQVQKFDIPEKNRKGQVAFIDAEHALDLEYAEILGFNTAEALITQPDSGEQALNIALDLVESKEVDFIIIDSIAALTPKAELEGEMGDQQMGLQARMMGKAVRKLTSAMGDSKCTILFLNQIRQKIGVLFGSPDTTPGGNAVKFASSIRLEIRKIEFMTQSSEIIGLRTRLKGVKNKTAPPMKKHELEIYFDRGFDPYLEWVDFAIQYDVIQQSGAWFKVPNREDKLQGKNGVINYLKENEQEYNNIIEETKKRMYPVIKKENRIPLKEKEVSIENKD